MLATVLDRKTGHLPTTGATLYDYWTADIASSTDYYPGGMPMPGRTIENTWSRHGYQGSAKDDEVYGKGNLFTTTFREGDTRLLRWWSNDPKQNEFPWQSSYSYMNGNPVQLNDPEGDAPPVGAIGLKILNLGRAIQIHPVVQILSRVVTAVETANPEGTQAWKDKQGMIGRVAMANAKAESDEKTESAQAEGKIYRVPGEKTASGKPYVGRTQQTSPEQRGKNGKPDGRDRKDADVVDTYDPKKPGEGAYKEQKQIDKEGGLERLDNKRNEVSQERMEKLDKIYGEQ